MLLARSKTHWHEEKLPRASDALTFPLQMTLRFRKSFILKEPLMLKGYFLAVLWNEEEGKRLQMGNYGVGGNISNYQHRFCRPKRNVGQ